MMTDYPENPVKEEWLDEVILEASEDDITREEEPSCDVTLQIFDEPYDPPSHSMASTATADVSEFEGVAEAIKAVSAESFDVSYYIGHNMEVVSRSREAYRGQIKPEPEDGSYGEGSEIANVGIGTALDVIAANSVVEKYTCSICEHSADSKNLELHMKTHYEDEARPFACNICNYRCSSAYHLKRHRMVHTGEKPFACSVCDYRSYRADKVKRHARTHTGEKPFACLYCDYRASRADHLTAHLRSHTRKHY